MKRHYRLADGFTACGRDARHWAKDRPTAIAYRANEVNCLQCQKHPDVKFNALSGDEDRDEIGELLRMFSGDPESRMIAAAVLRRYECRNLAELRDGHPDAFTELVQVVKDLNAQMPFEPTPGWAR